MLDNALLEKRAAANDSESSLANTKGNSVMQVACGKDDDRNESQDAIDSTKKDVVAEEFINDTEEKSAEEKNSDVKKVVTWETDANEEPESHIEDNKNYPCILHMDSLGMHSIKSISRRLIRYILLVCVYCLCNKFTVSE